MINVSDFMAGIIWPVWKHLRPIYWAYQRVHQGWSDRDVWNLNHYIQGILATSLIHLRDTMSGSPCDGTNSPDDCHERWNKELTEAAALFQRLYAGEYYEGAEPWKDEERDYQAAMAWLTKWGQALWD